MAKPDKGPVLEDQGGLLEDAELKRIEAEARAEVEAEEKARQEASLKASIKEKIRRETLFKVGKDAKGNNTETVFIDLAPHSPFIVLDGVTYFNNQSYKLTRAQAQTVKEVMSRTWDHEREIKGGITDPLSMPRHLNRKV